MKKKHGAKKAPRAKLVDPIEVQTEVGPPESPPQKDERSLCEVLEALQRPGAIEWNAAIQEAIHVAKAFDARIAAALAVLRNAEKYTGGFWPYGYELDEADGESLKKVEREQQAIARVRTLRAADPKISLRAIAQQLEEEELVARNGKCFKPTQINRMLHDEAK